MSTLSGAWLFRESLNDISSSINENINFSTLRISGCTEINIYFIAQTMRIEYINPNNFVNVYQSGTGWVSPSYRFVDFGDEPQEVSNEFFNWVVANAAKQNNKYNLIKALEVTTKAIIDYSNSKNNDLHTKMMSEFERDRTNILINRKRITNLEQGLPSEQFMTDSTVAHVKDVPVNALPFAEVSKVGGMTRKCTNLLPYPYVNTTKTTNGITFTDNGDGSITVNGTSTNDAYFTLANGFDAVNGVTYKLSGNVEGTSIVFTYVANDGSKSYESSITKDEGHTISDIRFHIKVGNTFNNVVLYPMLNEGSTALPYEPYYEGLRDAKVTEIESVGVNLIPYPYVDTTKTTRGITFTDNGDGSITVNGTATDDAYFVLANGFDAVNGVTYKLSINVEGVSIIFTYVANDGSTTYQSIITKTDGYTVSNIRLHAKRGGTFNNVVLYPMLNKGTTAQPYRPYQRNTLPIPEAVQALDGYGEGNPDNAEEYNAIINKDGKWKYSHKGNIKNNLWLPLATPEVTDISDLLSADNFLAVEGGGTVTAVNEYGYDVQSEITYMLKETTV